MWETGDPASASSPTARAFDAGVSVSGQGTTLFYVVARNGIPDAAVSSVGGKLVSRLPDPRQALALAPIAAHAKLRDHADLSLAGPVTVDAGRFGRFISLAGMSRLPDPAPTTSP